MFLQLRRGVLQKIVLKSFAEFTSDGIAAMETFFSKSQESLNDIKRFQKSGGP